MTDPTVPSARDLMSPVRLRLAPETGILDAIDQLVGAGVTAAMVVDEAEQLIGILTEKDSLRVLASAAYENIAQAGSVADYMSPITARVEATMDLMRATREFLGCNFPTLPVVDGGRLVGRLTRQDLLRGVHRFQLERTEELQRTARFGVESLNRPRSIQAMQERAAQSTPKTLASLFSRNR